MTRVVAIADLPGNLPGDLPEGDVLVIAGDVCPISDHAIPFQEEWLRGAFPEWLASLPHDEIVWIAGVEVSEKYKVTSPADGDTWELRTER